MERTVEASSSLQWEDFFLCKIIYFLREHLMLDFAQHPFLSSQPDGSCPSTPFSCRVFCQTPLPIKAWPQPQCYQASQSQHAQRSRSSTNMGGKPPFLPIPSHKFNYLDASLLEQKGTRRDITAGNLEPPRTVCEQAHQPCVSLLLLHLTRFFIPWTFWLKKDKNRTKQKKNPNQTKPNQNNQTNKKNQKKTQKTKTNPKMLRS